MKAYSVRKMGTRRGEPHYGAECVICRRVLAVAHMTKDGATGLAKSHVATQHGIR
jgi:hypothetical protein